jgi:hypothetical protein
VHSATVIPRMPASVARCRVAAFLTLAAITCLVLGACSPGVDYPSLFPAVHEIPPPRADATLDSNQVQQATEDLISARDRLSAEAQGAQGNHGAQGKNATNSAVKPAANSGANTGAKSAAKAASTSSANATAARKPPNNEANGRQTLGGDAEATAGTETK